MKILGTYNHFPFSWLIRKITGSKISHIVIVFDDLLIFHSTPKGTSPGWLQDFMVHNKIATFIPLPLSLISEERVYFSIVAGRKKRSYDWGGIAYQGYARLKQKLVGGVLPAINEWQNPHQDFCVEVLESVPWDTLKKGLQSKVDELPLSMMSPEEILNKLKSLLEESNVDHQ